MFRRRIKVDKEEGITVQKKALVYLACTRPKDIMKIVT